MHDRELGPVAGLSVAPELVTDEAREPAEFGNASVSRMPGAQPIERVLVTLESAQAFGGSKARPGGFFIPSAKRSARVVGGDGLLVLTQVALRLAQVKVPTRVFRVSLDVTAKDLDIVPEFPGIRF